MSATTHNAAIDKLITLCENIVAIKAQFEDLVTQPSDFSSAKCGGNLGIPGCAKSALCKEILNTPGGLGDDRPVHSLMGDLIKGRYWQKVSDERRKKPSAITLADKNAPNEEVWKQSEDMCRSTKCSAVPVVPDSEGTDTNPFSLDALAVFIFRVLQRVNHPGNLDKMSPNAGYVLLMFYNLYDGKNRKEFESELVERFGALIKMPLLKADRIKDLRDRGHDNDMELWICYLDFLEEEIPL